MLFQPIRITVVGFEVSFLTAFGWFVGEVDDVGTGGTITLIAGAGGYFFMATLAVNSHFFSFVTL